MLAAWAQTAGGQAEDPLQLQSDTFFFARLLLCLLLRGGGGDGSGGDGGGVCGSGGVLVVVLFVGLLVSWFVTCCFGVIISCVFSF